VPVQDCEDTACCRGQIPFICFQVQIGDMAHGAPTRRFPDYFMEKKARLLGGSCAHISKNIDFRCFEPSETVMANPSIPLSLKNTVCRIAACLALLPAMLSAQSVSEAGNQASRNLQEIFERLKMQHKEVLDAMNAREKDGEAAPLDDPKMPSLLKKGWVLAGEWASAYFESHSQPSEQDLARLFDGFAQEPKGYKSKYGNFLEYRDYRFSGNAVQIGSDIYVVCASYFLGFPPTGTFLVVARNRNGHFQALWNIKDIAEEHYALKDEIGRWMHLTRAAYYNGPLEVSKIMLLPNAANGHVRFIVDACQSAHGSMVTKQLSIWEWDGTDARLLLIGLYYNTLGYGGFQFDGRTLNIITKEQAATFYTASANPEPRGTWSIKIEPDCVQDLGRRFEKPELQWADDLFAKISKGEDVSGSANTVTVEALKTRIQEKIKDNATLGIKSFTWGDLWQCRILRRGRKGVFELKMEEGLFRLSYTLRNGKPYFTDVKFY
jgi:hypothetical protein